MRFIVWWFPWLFGKDGHPGFNKPGDGGSACVKPGSGGGGYAKPKLPRVHGSGGYAL